MTRTRWIDLGVALACAIVGFSLYLGAWQQQGHVINLSGDAGNISSFSAATEHPELFRGDEVLGNPSNFAEYMTVHIPSTMWLRGVTGGDYGWAFLLPLMILGLVQLLGCYALGYAVLRSRPFAVAFAAASLCIVQLPGLGEYWGAQAQGTPREWFQSFLPWILCAAWRWRADPRAWTAVFFTMGLMMYVHPVSAPGWTTAIWLGFLVSRPGDRRWRRHVGLLCAASLAFFVAAMLFVRNYLGHHEHGATRFSYDQIITIFKYRFAPGYLELPSTVWRLAVAWTWNGILPAGVAGAVAVWRFAPERRSDLVLVLAWLGGLVLIGTLVPISEQAIAAQLQVIPVEVDLIRTLRYVIPLLELLALWGAMLAIARLPEPARRWGPAVPVVLFFALAHVAKPTPLLANGAHRLFSFGGTNPPSPQLDALLAVRDLTPEGATILPSNDADALPVRYLSLRPVVYAWKDGGMLGYANHDALLQWYQRALEMKPLAKAPEETRMPAMFDAARRYGAAYLLYKGVVDEAGATAQHATIVYANRQYTLLAL